MVEIILCLTLMGFLFILASTTLTQGLDSYAHIQSRTTNLQAARYAMDRMVRELIRVEDDNQSNIQNIQETSIQFVDDLAANVTYQLSGTDLMRNEDILLGNVSSLLFTGYRDNNQTTSSGQQTRRVRIELSTLPPGQSVPLNLRTDIFIRNYMYEKFQ